MDPAEMQATVSKVSVYKRKHNVNVIFRCADRYPLACIAHSCEQLVLLLLLLLLLMLLLLQLTEQVQRINSKLQDSISTLNQTVAGNGSAAAGLSGSAAPGAANNTSSGTRAKIDTMSAEVIDSNPYSRLMALQRMGIVTDYERIRSKTVSGQQQAFACLLALQAVVGAGCVWCGVVWFEVCCSRLCWACHLRCTAINYIKSSGLQGVWWGLRQQQQADGAAAHGHCERTTSAYAAKR
jgi:hypothetical protein